MTHEESPRFLLIPYRIDITSHFASQPLDTARRQTHHKSVRRQKCEEANGLFLCCRFYQFMYSLVCCT